MAHFRYFPIVFVASVQLPVRRGIREFSHGKSETENE